MALKRRTSSTSAADVALDVVLKRLPHERVRCVDVETTGLDWRRNAIVGYVLTFSPDPKDSYYVPFRHHGTANVGGRQGLDDPHGWDGKVLPEEKELVRLLDVPDTLIFGHHLNFDLKFLWRVGMEKFEPRFEDSYINAPLLDEFQPKFSLEYCANKAGVQAKKSEEIVRYLCEKFPEAAANPRNAMGQYWRLSGDDPVGVEYACGDGTSTWQLRDWQMGQLRKQSMEDAEYYLGNLQMVDRDSVFDKFPCLMRVHDVESRLIPILARMSVRGIKIDEGRLGWLERHIDAEIGRLASEFPEGFNSRSNDDVVRWMTDHGCTDWPMTAGGVKSKPKPSMKEEWLETHEAGKKVIAWRKFETLKSTFVEPMRNTHLWKGRVHTNFNQLRGDQYGTVTGRLSSSEPNLQAVPKHNEVMGRLFRSIFVPDDGKIWGERDWSQMEPRLLAYYSRCRVLLDGYNADPPIDAHMAASVAACGPKWEGMSKAERKQYRDDVGKRINQLIITGGGAKTMARKYHLDESDARTMFQDYFRAMPEVKKLQKVAAAKFRKRGYVVSLLGRRARLNDDRDYTAVNRLLQVGNADAIKDKMVEMDDYLASEGRPLDMLLNCHDALSFQFPEEERRHYDECVRIMGDFSSEHCRIKLDVPITTDGDEGANWADATYGEEKK